MNLRNESNRSHYVGLANRHEASGVFDAGELHSEICVDLHVYMKVWGVPEDANEPLLCPSMHVTIAEYMPHVREMPDNLPILGSTSHTST